MKFLTWKKAISIFVNSISIKNLSPHSINSIICDLKKLAKYAIKKNIKLNYLSSKNITQYQIDILSTYLCNKSQNRHLSSIRQFIKFWTKEQGLTHNHFSSISCKSNKKLPIFLNTTEINKLIDISKLNIKHYTMINLLYASGIRISELLNIEYKSIDLENALIIIKGKRNKERLVPINLRTTQSISNFIKSNKTSTNVLFKMKRQSFSKILNYYIQKINIKKSISPHKIRHSFASHLFERGADLRIIQTLLGHNNLSTTEIYTHINTSRIHLLYEKYHS